MNFEKLARNINYYQNELSLSEEEFGIKLAENGYTPKYSYQDAIKSPSEKDLQIIAETLEVTIKDLLK